MDDMERKATVRNNRGVALRWGRVVVALLCLFPGTFHGADNPLAPIDTSTPRATMASFLALTEEAARCYLAYRDSPSPSTQDALWQLTYKTERLFDLSQVAPAARRKVSDETFYLLWEALARIELPDLAEIPDGSNDATIEGMAASPVSWRIPGTEITIRRVGDGLRTGEYLFSPDTVDRAPRFYEMARELPYLRPMPLKDVYRIHQSMTGWMIPMVWVERLPAWTNTPVLGQVLWKWLALLLLIGIPFGILIAEFRLVRRKPWDGSVRSYLRYLLRPLALLFVTLLVGHLATQQVNVTGAATGVPDYMLELAKGVAGVWGIWLTARWIAGVLVASPRDVSLMRLVVQAIGILAAIAIVFRMAHNLGIPVYGLVAGAGVGGLGIALAARSTLENFLGTLNLYADRPVRVGDFCRYGKEAALGTIEEIGLRSTRIRGIDRTITTVPNAEFSNMHIINLTRRDRMLFRTILGLRYETTPDQLRLVLVRIREMLVAHPRVTMAPSRVRAVGFGEYSLDLEIFAYVKTADWDDFLAVQEDLVLRLLDIVADAGAAFAFPSRTLYHGRDVGTDDDRREAAEDQVRNWVAAHELPFPDLSAEHRKRLRDTLDYPPTGSVADERR